MLFLEVMNDTIIMKLTSLCWRNCPISALEIILQGCKTQFLESLVKQGLGELDQVEAKLCRDVSICHTMFSSLIICQCL